MLAELKTLEEKFRSLTLSLSDPALLAQPQKIREISRERSELEPVVRTYEKFEKVRREIADARAILADAGADPDLRDLARDELKVLEDRGVVLESELRNHLLPKDPNDRKNAIFEIRAGAGGNEASLFAQDLLRMYSRFADRRKWVFEVLDTSLSPAGGVKEAVVNIRGQGVYGIMKHESGVHRVQRVPRTDAQGRIHTSTATVAVLPEAEEVDIRIDPKDLRIEAFGASGPGGQSVNRNYTAIRVTHKPTGMVVSCQDEKSQHKNKEKALRVLRSRLLDIAESEQHEQVSRDRRSQVGTGERSEKIRTYNFPQSRITDHRINENFHNLEAFLDGELDDILEKLALHFQSQAAAGLGKTGGGAASRRS